MNKKEDIFIKATKCVQCKKSLWVTRKKNEKFPKKVLCSDCQFGKSENDGIWLIPPAKLGKINWN